MPNERFDKLVNKIGRAGVHALFPNDFELYMMFLELVDSKGQTLDFLTFPVNPTRISYDNTKIVNIKKSLGGISAIDTETFTPKTISLSGSFGRKFKLLLGKPPTSAENSYRSTEGGIYGKVQSKALQVKEKSFDVKLKTGYGTLKILESMIDKSSGLDLNGEPFRLFLYNPTLNQSFLVKCTKLNFTQDYQNNMLWNYNIDFVAIAETKSLRDQAKEGLSDLKTKHLTKKGDTGAKQTRSIRKALKRFSRTSKG